MARQLAREGRRGDVVIKHLRAPCWTPLLDPRGQQGVVCHLGTGTARVPRRCLKQFLIDWGGWTLE